METNKRTVAAAHSSEVVGDGEQVIDRVRLVWRLHILP